jgi:predicted DNA binding protein
LTDRQHAALRAAYFGGYFDWPRGSTAEEVADAMGVSSPTLHNHLRKGQRELLRVLFEG